MKVDGTTAMRQIQQIGWQKVADQKQQKLIDAAEGKTLQKVREQQQFEIYQAKGKRVEIEPVSLPKRINIEV
jgi:hypothetical protein